MGSKDRIFQCQMCGNCCRNVDRYYKLLPKLRELLKDDSICFPYNSYDGVCEHLTPDNKCAIYEQRPIVCNTSIMLPMIAQATNHSIDEMLECQKISCLINNKRR